MVLICLSVFRVKRQRYQYRLFQEESPHSTMTAERIQVLEDMGFAWDAHMATWFVRYAELKAFALEKGHCNVPSNYIRNPKLSNWVKFQRRLVRGNKVPTQESSSTGMSVQRYRLLEEIGFQWEIRLPPPPHTTTRPRRTKTIQHDLNV